MKLKFDSNLDYQQEAIKAVTDLFDGQTSMMSYFSLNGQTGFDLINFNPETEQLEKEEQKFGQGVGNRLTISKRDVLENLRKVQTFHKLAPSESLKNLDFNIEMETGTGKTYVYLRTIFELNRLYGFKKFIIVVPSIAIKEGVYKTLQITEEHFKLLYDNVVYDYFVYDSGKLEQVRNFAINSNIEIMVINIDAFNKSFTKTSFDDTKKTNNANIIHRPQDRLSGYKPIDMIAETKPIVIIDEPQSVMGGKGEEAVSYLNPLCTLRYSATHKEIQNLIYKLDAVDAYEKELVKRIEVASFESEKSHNRVYLKLLSTNIKSSPISAKIEADVNENGVIKRKPVTINKGNDLADLTNREIYQGYIVDEINCEKGNEYVSFTQKEDKLKIGVPIGDMDELKIKRAQIRRTIEEHLDKELRLNKKGIKVLSLFFIDKVANYRLYDEEGNYHNGIYADIFEEEFKDIIEKNEDYASLYSDFDLDYISKKIHNGYFSKDRKGKEYKQKKNGEFILSSDDNDTFNLIMKDKEKLLSFNYPLKFIFSHSALREGWDNPNVFQICTLNETTSTMKKRQEIGRGLRLCVNQSGERVFDRTINTLTIMANESYDSFAKSLQEEMEEDTGIKFGIIEKNSFAHITMENRKGIIAPIGIQGSLQIYNHFKKRNYIDGKGKVQDALKVDLMNENLDVPERFESIKEHIIEVASRRTKKLNIVNKNAKVKVKVNKHVLLSSEFRQFWDKIKHKTTYSVDFDTKELIRRCGLALSEKVKVSPSKLILTKSALLIDASGVNVDEHGKMPPTVVYAEEQNVALPDIIRFLQNNTFLTRRTIVKVLTCSGTLNQFKINPEEYMAQCLKIIKQELNHMLLKEIKYSQLEDFYSQELFEEDELYGYLEKNLIKSEHSVYDYVFFDSEVERDFATNLEKDPDVILYTKLPRWFKINTPLGGYNPDWAILLNDNGAKKMYFVVETKGNIDSDSLRFTEKAKIDCGKKHFKALETGVNFTAADSYAGFKTNMD